VDPATARSCSGSQSAPGLEQTPTAEDVAEWG